MAKYYEVAPGLGNWLILRKTKDLNGNVVKVEIADSFIRRDEALTKCRLSNYIALKAREACRRLAGVK